MNSKHRKRVPTSVNPRYDADAPDGDFACWEVSQTLFCGGLHPLKIFKKLWQKCGCAVVGEVTFSDLPLDEARQLHTFDEYFKRETAETVFEKAGKKITPKLLLEAIRTLPEEKRKAVLLYYFEGMNDTEIAKLFNTSRSTIQYRRTSSFEKLRKYLEENADEWDEW